MEATQLIVGRTGLQTQEHEQQAIYLGSSQCTASVRGKRVGKNITARVMFKIWGELTYLEMERKKLEMMENWEGGRELMAWGAQEAGRKRIGNRWEIKASLPRGQEEKEKERKETCVKTKVLGVMRNHHARTFLRRLLIVSKEGHCNPLKVRKGKA